MFGPEYARSCGIAALEPLGVYLQGDKNYPGEGALEAGVGLPALARSRAFCGSAVGACPAERCNSCLPAPWNRRMAV